MSFLCYHTVDDAWQSRLVVHPASFDRQCRWLAENREVVSLSEGLARAETAGWRLPRGATVLTFDDGLAGLYQHAFPILLRYRLPAVVYLVARTLAEPGTTVDWVEDAPDFRLSTLTRDQVLEMQEAGIEFGSHSWAHHDLTGLSESDCEEDLRASREFLSDLLGHQIHSLAYPRGRHDPAVRRAARRAGYAHAFSLPEEHDEMSAFAVPRVGIYPPNAERALAIKTARWYLPVRMSPLFPPLRHGWRALAAFASSGRGAEPAFEPERNGHW